MDRPAIHDLPKPVVIQHLETLGLTVKEASPMQRYDFTVQGRVRLALRVAFPSSSRRRVRVKRRLYQYVYRAWNFNFHHRGVVGAQYCDFFLCVPLGTGKPPSMEDVYVIPWSAITGKTFYLPEARRPYRGRFARYRNGWQQIVETVRARELASRAA
ncbi:MAG: hypothetical protein KatS3mg076_2133 [Candidatus Binatia bacterium]|nr:MAG: hypothetical protein KatS3mg076_2133 [Candidatus Binatia bacterium]